MKGLNKAIESLCDEINYGHLKAQTDPKALIEEVTERIKRLRKALEEIEEHTLSSLSAMEIHDIAKQALKEVEEGE